MRVMVIVKATKESEAESNPLEMEGAEEMFEQMGRFNEELIKAGIMLAGDGLKPSKFGKRIHFNGTKRSVTDGPFAETKELVAGFWIWQVRSMDEAIEWAKRCPNPMPGPSDLEIRPIWEPEEFGPEIAAGVNELRAKIAKRLLCVAGAHLSGEPQLSAVVETDEQRAELCARSLRRRVSGYDEL